MPQRLDQVATRLGRPSGLVVREQRRSARLARRVRRVVLLVQLLAHNQKALETNFMVKLQQSLADPAPVALNAWPCA